MLETYTVEMQELLDSITMCSRTAQLKLATFEHIYKIQLKAGDEWQNERSAYRNFAEFSLSFPPWPIISTDYTKSVRSRAAVKRASRAADVRDEAAANQQRGLTAHQADVREENLRSLRTPVLKLARTLSSSFEAFRRRRT